MKWMIAQMVFESEGEKYLRYFDEYKKHEEKDKMIEEIKKDNKNQNN